MRGGLWVVFSTYWIMAFGFGVNVLLTRMLGPEVFGLYVLALFLVQALRLQTKLGVGYAFVSYGEVSGRTLGTYIGLDLAAIVLGVALPLLLVPLLPPLLVAQGYSLADATAVVQVSSVLAVGAGLQGVWTTGYMLLEREMHFGPVSLLHSVCFPLSFLPALVLALLGAGVWSLVAHTLVFYTLLIIGMVWLLRRYTPYIWHLRWRFDLRLAWRLLIFGGVVGLGTLATLLLTQLDDMYIGVLVGLSALGFYDRAYRIAQWPGLLLSSLINRTIFVTYVHMQGDRARLQQMVARVIWLITTLAVPLALAILLAAPDLVVLLYGESWLPAALFLRILVVFSVVQPFWEHASKLFLAMGKPRLSLWIMGTQALTLLVAGLPFTLFWGALGTCAAAALAFAVGLGLIYRNIRREVALDLGRALAPPLGISLLVLLGYVALNRLTGLNDWPLLVRIGAKGMYGVGAFAGLLLLFQPRTTYEQVAYLIRLFTQRRSTTTVVRTKEMSR